jgi:DNA-binding protein
VAAIRKVVFAMLVGNRLFSVLIALGGAASIFCKDTPPRGFPPSPLGGLTAASGSGSGGDLSVADCTVAMPALDLGAASVILMIDLGRVKIALSDKPNIDRFLATTPGRFTPPWPRCRCYANPRTGEEIRIKASKASKRVAFRPAKSLKESI